MMPFNNKKSYDLLKSNKKSSSSSSGTYNKKRETKKGFASFKQFISKLVNWSNF